MIERLVVLVIVAWFGFWVLQWLTGAATLVVLSALGAALVGRQLRRRHG